MTDFKVKTREEELKILYSDDENYSQMKLYLMPLIEGALKKTGIKSPRYEELKNEIRADIPIAAKRFLGAKRDLEETYKFSTYFAWYISEHIRKETSILEKIKKHLKK